MHGACRLELFVFFHNRIIPALIALYKLKPLYIINKIQVLHRAAEFMYHLSN